MANITTTKTPRWKKIIALHESGAIDLKQVPVRGYSETIRAAYSKAHKGEKVSPGDWVKAYRKQFGKAHRSGRRKVSTPLTIETALKVKHAVQELGGRKIVNQWVETIKNLEKLAGGDIADVLRQIDELTKS